MAHQDQTQGVIIRELQTLLLTGHAMSEEQDQERICLWATDAASSMLGSSLAAVALNASDSDDQFAVYGKLRDSLLGEHLTISLSKLVEIEWPAPQAPGQAATLQKKRLPGALTREGINYMVRMPVRTIHQDIGVLLLGMGGPWEPGHQRQFILSTLANQAAIALENVRLRREADEQAETLKGLIQASPLAIIARDRQAMVQMWNPAAERIFGWSEEEVLGRPYPLVPQGKEDEFRANIARALRGEPLTGLETLRQKKDGTLIDVSIWTAPFGDGGAMVVIADVSERKQAEEALRESEERYRSLYESTPVMMHSIDHDGRLVSVNNHWLRVLGYKRKQVIGRRSTEFLTEASRRYAIEVALPEFRKTGYAKDVEYQMLKKSGEVIDVRLSAIADRDEAGEIRRTLAFIDDVTERKRAEEALRELVVLEERNRIAREIHDSIAQGLTGIIWQINALERTVPSAGGLASDALDRVRNLAKDSLREARRSVWDLRSGPLQGVSLRDTLQQELDKGVGIGDCKASVAVQGDEKVLPSGVETALLRICQESLVNVLKYAHASEVIVTLHYEDDHVRLTVQDDGRGFDPETPRQTSASGGGLALLA